MKAMREQVDEQPKNIKLFSINYARDLIKIRDSIKALLFGIINLAILNRVIFLKYQNFFSA